MPMLETAQGTVFYAQRCAEGPPPTASPTGGPGGSLVLPLVCIHGAGGTHQHWGEQLRGLSDTLPVFALDLPGHGRSPGPGRTRIAEYSAVLLATLDALGLDQVILAGHSMGGAVALWTAITAPERVAGLVLVGTGARLHIMAAILDGLEQNPVLAVRMIVERVYDQYTILSVQAAGEAGFLQVDPVVFQGDLMACDNFDIRQRLGEIHAPTLVVCGETDQMTPVRFSLFLSEQIANAELVQVPRAGHMVIIEQPAAFNEALRIWALAHFTSQYRSG